MNSDSPKQQQGNPAQNDTERPVSNIVHAGIWFVDIPRTGSSSMRTELGRIYGSPYAKANIADAGFGFELETQLLSDHMSAGEIIGLTGRAVWDRLFSFSFVRNPWDRAHSLYQYRRRIKMDIPMEMSLKQYLTELAAQRALPEERRDWYAGYTRSCSEFLLDDSGTLAVSHVGRFESREQDLDLINQHLREPVSSGLRLMETVTEPVPFQNHYDEVSRDLIGELFADDIKTFGYSFNERIALLSAGTLHDALRRQLARAELMCSKEQARSAWLESKSAGLEAKSAGLEAARSELEILLAGEQHKSASLEAARHELQLTLLEEQQRSAGLEGNGAWLQILLTEERQKSEEVGKRQWKLERALFNRINRKLAKIVAALRNFGHLLYTPLHRFDPRIHQFANGIKVYRHQLIPLQLERYAIVNLHEPAEEHAFNEAFAKLPEGGVFLDVGAAIGYHSLLAAQTRKNLEIHAFEPQESMQRNLKANIAINRAQGITIETCALADSVGYCDISGGFGAAIHDGGAIPQSTLDRFIAKLGKPIDLIKLDIQGVEFRAIQGARASLDQINAWIVGTHSPELHQACLAELRNAGYTILFEDPAPEGQPDGLIHAMRT